jgi:uncharacterized NAD-dependent epimerase/dehydratase family protein
MSEIKRPYCLFLGDAKLKTDAKIATAIVSFRPGDVVGSVKLADSKVSYEGVKELSIKEAALNGAKSFVIGCANLGGFIDEAWVPSILEAIENGMDIVSGMHMKLEDIPEINALSAKHGALLHNIRHTNYDLKPGTGKKRHGKRILAVGTDCSVGKMYTTLILEKAMKEKGYEADFRATGQTGILVTGEGIAVDAIVSDFISGAVEMISPDNKPDHYDIIEGQGSLFHPAYAGVSLGLLHGAQADYIVLCHEPNREYMRHLKAYDVPGIEETISLNIQLGSLTNKNIKCIGVSVNTSLMQEGEAQKYKQDLSAKLNLPVVDPCVDGVESLIDNL